jgi:thymidylate kinase
MERVFGAQKEKTDSWIVLEGADGTGKSTLAKLAAEQIPDLVVVEEPSGTPQGRAVAKLLYEHAWTREARIMFYGGLVRHTYDTTIYPLIQSGKRVLSVRSFPSTFAYQGDTEEDLDFIANMYADLLKDIPCPKIVVAIVEYSTVWSRLEQRDKRVVRAEEARDIIQATEWYREAADEFNWDVLHNNNGWSIEDATEALVGMIT